MVGLLLPGRAWRRLHEVNRLMDIAVDRLTELKNRSPDHPADPAEIQAWTEHLNALKAENHVLGQICGACSLLHKLVHEEA